MEATAAELLLTEFREFRREITEWKQDTTERIVRLETVIKPALQGNGQPSRLQVAEDKIDQLNRFRYWLLGFAGVISATFHYLLRNGGR